MKKLSKIVVLCLTLLLIASMSVMLTACDDDSGGTETPTTPSFMVTFYRNYFDLNAENERVYEEFNRTTAVNSVSVKRGEKIKTTDLKDPDRIGGYTFDGWYADVNCEVAFDFSAPITNNTSVYAGWKSNGKSADVSLKDPGDKPALVEQTVTVKLYDNTLTRAKDENGNPIESDEAFEARKYVKKQVSTGVWRYSVDIPNSEKSFNFVTKGFQSLIYNGNSAETSASYEIYTDEACKKTADNPVALSNGDNYFYMKVTAEDDIVTKVYKINIYLTPAYKVTVETVNNSGNFKVNTVSKGAKLNAPAITETTNPGYSFEGWYYMWTQKLNDYGQYVDADGNVLERAGTYPNYVYYLLNSAGNRIPIYTFVKNTFDENGNLVNSVSGNAYYNSEDGKYYQTDKKGNLITDKDKNPIVIDEVDLFNVVDEDGLPTYVKGIPVSAQSGLFECKWDFEKCVVDKNVTIYGKWKANTYTVTLDLNEPNINVVSYSGDTTFSVKYGIQAEALGNLIKTACANHYPTHQYAVFLGWEDEAGNLMVNANGIGLNGWNIASDAILKARWNYNTYNVRLSTDLTMGEVAGGGSVVYGGSANITATPKTGYEFVNWTLGGAVFSTLKTDTYQLDLADLEDDEVKLVANFRLKTVNVTLDYRLAEGEAFQATLPATLTLTYGKALYGTGESVLPTLDKASPNGERLFVGWFYDDAEGNSIQLSDKNAAIADGETWSDEVITYLQSMDSPSIYVKWNPNNYTVSAYNAMYGTANMGSIVPVVTLPDGQTGTMNTAIEAASIDGYGISGVSTEVTFGTKFSFTLVNNKDTLYRFIGWYYIDMTVDNPLLAALASTPVEDEDTEKDGLQITLGEGDVAIVAVWYYQPVTIYLYNEDGTEFDTASVQKDIGKLYSLPLPDLRLTYNFMGWATRTGRLVTDAKGNSLNMLNNTELIETGLELYAKWKKKNYFAVDSNGIITGLTDDGINKQDGIFEIPTTDDNGNDINGIGAGAFKDDTHIKQLTICGNIKLIGEGAFEGCKMTSVTFKGEFKGLTVASGAFMDCTGLTSVVLPDATVAVEAGAFEGCYKLSSLTYPATVPLGMLFSTTEPEDSNWYAAEQNGVIYFLPNLLTNVIVSNTSDTICDYAFENCVNVVSITLATEKADKQYTKNIGKYAFALTGDSGVNRPTITVNLQEVENIGYSAFLNSGINVVELGALTKLGDSAFRGSDIQSVDFSTSPLDYISSSCFRDCKSLTNLNYGNVNTVYNHAFDGCTNYTTINGDAGKIKIIQSYAYYNAGITAVTNFTAVEQVGQYAFQSNVANSWYAKTNTGLLTIGKVIYFYKGGAISTSNTNATSIAMGAFENVELVNTSIDLTGYSALKIIYNNAFEGSDLVSITLPSSLTTIKENAFKNCAALTTVNMTACVNLKNIGASVFSGCKKLTSVSFVSIDDNDALAASTKLSIAEYAFEGCDMLAVITLPDNLASLGKYAFKDCISLNEVNFVKNSKYEAKYGTKEDGGWGIIKDAKYIYTTGLISIISEGTFYNCTALTSIELPYFITAISNYAFYGCSNLVSESNTYLRNETAEEKIYGSSLKAIYDYAFANATKLVNTKFGTDINYLGVAAFENCKELLDISIVNVTGGIPARAFNGCEKLISVITPASVSSVGEMAFQNCFNLLSLSAASGIGDVGAAAFKNCRLLDGIKLMSSSTATEIGEEAFRNCSALTTVTIPSTIKSIGANAFADCTSLNTVYFGSETESSSVLETVGISAFENTALISVTLPSTLVSVEASAFANNKMLVSVTLGADVAYIGADAFEGCNNITVTLLGTAVPALGGDLFTTGNTFTVVIRSGYLCDFENNEDWAVYKDNIVESAA